MALVHDMAEALAGDIAPSDGISKAEKHRMETEALAAMQSPYRPRVRQAGNRRCAGM